MTVQERFLAALGAVARALHADQLIEAAASIQLAVQATDEARAEKLILDPSSLEEAQRLFAQCIARSNELQVQLAGELAQAGLGRRAITAYRSR